ncbi:hypothetical protein EVAR_58842_1 [Eumeta japonica]|uniref:Gustatory receptor n=1 Tax=Eumeta variegata TaxID=151549 RepID=A0A4C1YUE6_EUMVA|nr:hypothetical protein EVAR_58842_1 [Eumeta japonica]
MSPTRVLVNNFIQIDNENETNKILKIYLIIGALLGADRLELCEDLKNLSKHFIRGFAFFLHVCIVITTVRYPRDGFGPRFLLAISFIEYFLYCSWAFVNPEVVCLEIANMRYKHDLKIARNSYRLIVEASNILQSATRVQEMWWINTLFAISLETLNFYLQTLPCRVCDQINAHVKELKATLALHLSSLYLDKEDRRRARSLMAYVEQHDLSFRLLSVAGVGAALPVAVLELTLTYLIILLQFGKLVENQLIVNA